MYKNNLYYIRVAKGLTQKDFAEELGMNPSLYSRYERGETNMSLEVAKGIAQYCNISLDYLAGLEEPEYDKVEEGLETIENRYGSSSKSPSKKEIIEDWIDMKLEPVLKRIEVIEQKLSADQSAETDSDQSED